MECCGITEEMLATATEKGYRDMALVEACTHTGYIRPFGARMETIWRALMKEARQQARQCDCLLGFYLDRAVNRIGTTGWESLRGDLTSALDRVAN